MWQNLASAALHLNEATAVVVVVAGFAVAVPHAAPVIMSASTPAATAALVLITIQSVIDHRRP
jgi:hypothetical protein